MNHNPESCPITLNTTRICADKSVETSIEVSKVGFSNMKPNAIILINENEIFDGIAATALVHLPINASLLFTNGNSLSKETLNEIQRLCPKGYKGVQIILVGNISKNVSSELNSHGFRTCHIVGRNHYETACMIPNLREKFRNILIISGEDYSEGIVAGYWSAHHGDPILYVKRDRIPYCTLEVIKKMKDVNIYIIGSTETVSNAVEKYLSNLDNVKRLDRIDGGTPYEIAVNFAKYKDHKTEFGWGRNYRDGHAFTFGELCNPMALIAGVLFAHMGKHTPALLIEKDKTPIVVEKYIKSVKPMPPKDMPRPPFMHGFILGSILNISHKAQVMIEDILSIDHEMMNMCDMHKMDHHKDGKHEKMTHDCMEHMGTMMHHPDHMMDMCDMHKMDHHKDGKHEKMTHDCMPHMSTMMHHPDHMMDMCDMHKMDHHKDGKHEKMTHDCMPHMGTMMHHPHHMMNMCDIHNMDHHKDGKHEKMTHDCMGHMGTMMHHPDHMMDMCDMHKMDHHKDGKHEKMTDDCNDKASKDHKSERSDYNYRRVSIDEILS